MRGKEAKGKKNTSYVDAGVDEVVLWNWSSCTMIPIMIVSVAGAFGRLLGLCSHEWCHVVVGMRMALTGWYVGTIVSKWLSYWEGLEDVALWQGWGELEGFKRLPFQCATSHPMCCLRDELSAISVVKSSLCHHEPQNSENMSPVKCFFFL